MKIYLISLFLCLSLTAQDKLLIFSKTAGYRHGSIEVGIQALTKLAEQHNYQVTSSEDSQIMTDKNLKNYRAIIFLSTTGDILNKDQQLAFQRFIQSGGGFVGIHAASDTEYDWPWYMRLIGAQFSHHPEVQQAVQEKCDCKHQAIDFLPQKWSRKDEWYNFKNISPNISPLLMLDESTYKGGENGDFHPSSWYQEYDGGRMFYTAGGHTKESFNEPLFLKHILGGIHYVCAGQEKDYTKALPDDDNFSLETLSKALNDPIAIAVSPDDEVFILERKGSIKLVSSGHTNELHQLDAIYKEIAPKQAQSVAKECGGLGIALDPNFKNNKYVYIYYSPKEKSCNRLSRFTFTDDSLSHEIKIIDVDTDRTNETCHEGGSLVFGNNRELFISTGDNTNPFLSHGAAPINEMPNHKFYDAQRSAGNSNDLRGAILRIIINEDGSYAIPKGNLFTQKLKKTRPEIYIKGCRNPYKMSIDHKTNHIYWGEVGPDAGDKTHRGPMGYDELNQAKEAGYYGWPYFVGDEAYKDVDFSNIQSGKAFSSTPKNDSPNNTGLKVLPEVKFPLLKYPYKKLDSFPDLGNGSRNAMAGPYYNQQGREASLPAYFDDTLFFYDWCRSKILLLKFNKDKKIKSLTPFMDSKSFIHPIDIQQSPKGEIYVLNYGSAWWNNSDGSLQKISFDGFNRRPILAMSADKKDGALPLNIQFSSHGSMDKDGDSLSYFWDFGDGRNSSEANPKISFSKAGIYKVTLTLSDSAGKKSSKSMHVSAGNEAPQITLKLSTGPKLFIWGQEINYEVKGQDKEDGKIDPSLIEVTAEYRPDASLPQSQENELADPRLKGMNRLHKGTKLIESNNCLTCHQSQANSIGPSYLAIAKKYSDSAKNRSYLLNKLKKGGNGVWGHMPMPPQSHITEIKLKAMISAIMEMGQETQLITKAKNGKLRFIEKPADTVDRNGVYIVKASYKDKGAGELPGLRGFSKTFILKPAIVIDGDKAVFNTQTAQIIGANARKEGNNNIGFYRNIDTSISWSLYVKATGKYQVYLYQACAKDKAGSSYELLVGKTKLSGKIQATDDWHDFSAVDLGTIQLNKEDSQQLIFQPLSIPHGDLGNIKGIILKKI